MSMRFFENIAISCSRKLGVGAFFAISSLTSLNANAQSDQANLQIYGEALQKILKHEKPERFAVAKEIIQASAIKEARLPRHIPEHQFIRSLHGLKPLYEQNLLSDENSALTLANAELIVPKKDTTFMGILSNEDLARLQSKVNEGSNKGSIVIGMSKIVFNNNRTGALIYSEVCGIFSVTTCGAEAFLFEKKSGNWKLKQHSYLWQGATKPFWSLIYGTDNSDKLPAIKSDGYKSSSFF